MYLTSVLLAVVRQHVIQKVGGEGVDRNGLNLHTSKKLPGNVLSGHTAEEKAESG